MLRQCSGRLEKAQGSVFWRLFSRMGKILDKLDGLLHTEQFIYWLEYVGGMECQLCALPKQLDFILYEDLWGKEIPYILTSATLSVGGVGFLSTFPIVLHAPRLIQSLYRMKDALSLPYCHLRLQKIRHSTVTFLDRIRTTSKTSPFDYQNHALLYLPEDMPFPDVRSLDYLNAVCGKVEALVQQTYGHTLILFTSYRMMGMVYQKLLDRITDYPLFRMGKGRLEVIKAFRAVSPARPTAATSSTYLAQSFPTDNGKNRHVGISHTLKPGQESKIILNIRNSEDG